MPERPFENFHFVRHSEVLRRAEEGEFDADCTDASLAAQALMHVPDHYAELASLGYLGTANKQSEGECAACEPLLRPRVPRCQRSWSVVRMQYAVSKHVTTLDQNRRARETLGHVGARVPLS